MDFNTFCELNESKNKTEPKIHVFKDYPSFKKVKELPEGDLYVVTNGDDTFFWDDGQFTINLFAATQVKTFFENSDVNYVQVDIDPSFDTSTDDAPSDFNSESGNIKYNQFLVIDGLDLKASDFTIDAETNHDKDTPEDEQDEIKRLESIGKSLKAKTLRTLFKGDVVSAINDIIKKDHDDFVEFEIEKRS